MHVQNDRPIHQGKARLYASKSCMIAYFIKGKAHLYASKTPSSEQLGEYFRRWIGGLATDIQRSSLYLRFGDFALSSCGIYVFGAR
jgi:hypothetical protein